VAGAASSAAIASPTSLKPRRPRRP
jgi:hypothetical protein